MCCGLNGGGAPSYVVLRQSPHCIFSSGGTSLNSVALNAGVDGAGFASRRFETLHICTITEMVYSLAQGHLQASAASEPTLVMDVRAVIRQCVGPCSQRFTDCRVSSFSYSRNTRQPVKPLADAP